MQNYDIEQYDYSLVESFIAESPLNERDKSKLLVYEDGDISHKQFDELPALLPSNAALVFNNTRVIRARIFFKRQSGALIEIFCLRPLEPFIEIQQAMQQRFYAVWECFAGNQRRWKLGETIYMDFGEGIVYAELLEKVSREVKVKFSWNPSNFTFSEMLEHVGKIPLPPYIHRELTPEDEYQYQTVYAKEGGAVAAPTAGLHFTNQLINELTKKGYPIINITLHVSAGTFQPVEEKDIRNHKMHSEEIVFTKDSIQQIINNSKNIIAVGTTSMRALESLYWFGVRLIEETDLINFFVDKLYPYQYHKDISTEIALHEVISWMDKKGYKEIYGFTEIMIMPGYTFKICKGLITNFHLPKSTLLMLIAAFIGDDWKKVYQSALENNYRFLSFGDTSLLLPRQ